MEIGQNLWYDLNYSRDKWNIRSLHCRMLKWVTEYIVDAVGTWVTLDMVTFVFGQEIHILNHYCVGIEEFTPLGMTGLPSGL